MNKRVFLFLQGPASPFLKFLAEALEKQGAEVTKLNFCIGDMVFWWPRKSTFFRHPHNTWADYLQHYLSDHKITDIVMLGDGRAVHATAASIGIERGLNVHILEHGYLRPDWLTIEPDGMSAHSRFPQDPATIARLARASDSVPTDRRYTSSFLTYALYDLAYHIPNVLLGWLIHPHYRTHGAVHPLVEYAGWVGKALTGRRQQQAAEASINAWRDKSPARDNVSRFLFPLQLPGDYQIRRHAPGGDLFAIVEATIASFARSAPGNARLLFKVHPIDNGLSRWPERISATASQHGVTGRVFYAADGNTDALIREADGIVTVNSTVGLTALAMQRPVIALGAALYDIDGLTHQGSLQEFWNAPEKPDAELYRTLQRALAATTQVRGGFIGRRAIEEGANNVAHRLLEEEPRLPLALRKPRGPMHFRHQDELFS